MMDKNEQENGNFEENLFYDFYKIPQQFSEEDLKNEVRPKLTWCHLNCAYWIPETFLVDKEVKSDPNNKVKTIIGLKEIDKARFKLACGVCGTKNTGACIQCCKGQCHASFHPECARYFFYF